MNSKHSLPSLCFNKGKTTFEKDRLKIENLFSENAKNRRTHNDYRHQEDFSQLKAANFLSRINTIDSPDVIFAVTDHLAPLASLPPQQENHPLGGPATPKITQRTDLRSLHEERQQAVILAKWMEEKLQKFRNKKSVTFMDIIQYKQTILNYALGRIIDSLSKKCREEGQLLSLIWNNTFTMFEGVFNILAQANQCKQRKKVQDQREMQEIFETNLNFLRQENGALKEESQSLLQKMKSVIIWNKRLRRDRKRLHTQNRILNYRNHTYHLALQETVELVLRSTPQPATAVTVKNIISRLAKQKSRKKKFKHLDTDTEIIQSTKDYIYQWLKRNSSLSEDIVSYLNEPPFAKEDCFMLEDVEDLNQMKKVDIYDYFKLFDVGVQANPLMQQQSSQHQPKTYESVQTMTKLQKAIDEACQTVNRHETIQSVNTYQNKQNNQKSSQLNKGSHFRQISRDKSRKKTDLVSQKSMKNIKKPHTVFYEGTTKLEKKQFHRNSHQEYRQNGNNATNFGKEDTASVFKRMDSGKMKEDYEDRQDKLSISSSEEDVSHTKGPTTTRHLITCNSLNSRLKSLHEIEQFGSSRKMFEGILRKKGKKQSVAYLSQKSQHKFFAQLKLKKNFNEDYSQNKKIMEENKQQFYDQIIRRRSFYGKKKVEFANFKGAEDATHKSKELLRGKPIKNRFNTFHEHSSYICADIQRLTKRVAAPSNIAKTKTLMTSQAVFSSIKSSIEQIARIPPNNKVFVNNSLTSIVKYIEGLFPEYIKQVKKQKEELVVDFQKALYPLNILLMEQMTFKYGLKGIADKKIKLFLQKVLTFAPISQKIGLFSLLLGLEQPDVGSDQLLVYIKCLVFFDFKRAFREVLATDSTSVDVQGVRQNLHRVLDYFFDQEYINLISLKLQIYFQQTAPFSTLEGIAIIIIKQLLKRKKELKHKFTGVYQICSSGDNFFNNLYKMIKIISCYHQEAKGELLKQPLNKYRRQSTQSMQALHNIRNRNHRKKDKGSGNLRFSVTAISKILKQMIQRSDIIDEEFGKSITLERFMTASVICGMPTISDLQLVFIYFGQQFAHLQQTMPIYSTINVREKKGLEQLASYWGKELPIRKEEDHINNEWTLARLWSQKVEEEVIGVMGKLGNIGLYIQSSLISMKSPK